MYRISMAAGALVALQGAWAQQPSQTDVYPAEHTEEVKGYEGQYVDACSPVGTVRFNSTFPPCLSASRIEPSCALPWKEGLSDEQRQGDWKAERKCLCDGSFFDDAGDGCLKCKGAYRIDSEENLAVWKGIWDKVRGSYCQDETLTGNFSSYFKAASDQSSFQPVKDLGTKPAAGSIPIEAYYKNDKQGPGPLPGSTSSNSTAQDEAGPMEGVAQLTPDCRTMIGAIDTLPGGNSAKFSNSSSGAILVSVQATFNRICIINGDQREVKAERKEEPVVTPISQEVVPKEKAAEKADFDMTGCSCAQKVVPEGKQVVQSKESVEAWAMVSVMTGFAMVGGQLPQGCEGAQCGAQGGADAGASAGSEASSSASGNVYSVDSVMGTFGGSAGGSAPASGGKSAVKAPAFVVKPGVQVSAKAQCGADGSCGQSKGSYGQKTEGASDGKPQCADGSCGQPQGSAEGQTAPKSGNEDEIDYC
ncbi:hypothetical protein XA68_13265 [Ophiocordyceps unilateralis]|uniref:Uncharacterized protein n=1 Tax=Ophiocordyceps unilateralis TaxID=268505 RepID=A0A2A9PNY7_OPHUN|nr:hypothetical protein XA68_13265 [Ophiocordyceps unilateralis]